MVRFRLLRFLLLGSLCLVCFLALIGRLLLARHADDAAPLPDTRPGLELPDRSDPWARRCATISVSDPTMAACAALWDAHRRHFFGLPARQDIGGGRGIEQSRAKEGW